MKRTIYIALSVLLALLSCERDGGVENPLTSGTVTINNFLSFDEATESYNLLGFSFAEARLVSILESTDYMTVGCADNVVNLQTNSYLKSFYLFGNFDDAVTAETVFNTLNSTSVASWSEWANPVRENQIWIFRTGKKTYAKLWIKSILIEPTDSVKCTFDWVYQPDGTLTFPGK